MIDYLIRSGLCLTILLAAYHLFLEREKMYRFNRFFLLFSLGFGLLIPLITIGLDAGPVKPIEFSQMGKLIQPAIQAENVTADTEVTTVNPYYSRALLSAYLIGAGILFLRLLVNLSRIISKVRLNPRIRSGDSVIVLITETVVPHSFLNYIFLNKNDYLNKLIEEQILVHEMAHVKQGHSLDILLAELLKIIFWFNPVFIGYKKALQLNHEFLADEKVITSYQSIQEYQGLLLKAAGLKTVNVASNFNYSLTKKRFMMMKKHTSGSIAMLKAAGLIPLLAILVALLSNQTIAQNSILPEVQKAVVFDEGNISKEEYFKGATIWIKNKDGKYIARKWEQLNATEKAAIPGPPSVRFPKQSPSLAMLTSLKSQLSIEISVDEKAIKNSQLANYKPEDFSTYWTTTYMVPPGVEGNRTSKDVLKTHKGFYTHSYYHENVVKPHNAPGKVLTVTNDYPNIKMHVGPPAPGSNGMPGPPVMPAP